MIKKIALGLLILVGLLVAYTLLTRIMEDLRSGERLSKSLDLVHQLEVKNKQLKAKLSEIQSPQFIEEEVRNKLGLAKAGETVVVIPEEKLKSVLGASQSAVVRLPNWLGWLKVFWH